VFDYDFFCSNPVLPQSFLEAPKKNPKRHPIHKKKGSGTAAGEDVPSSVDRAEEEELDEIPPDVQKVLEEMDLEEEEPDEDTLEVLEDIWLKAGEIGESKCIFTLKGSYEHPLTFSTKYCTDFFFFAILITSIL
jgi:jumonji domain-containing protein 2